MATTDRAVVPCPEIGPEDAGRPISGSEFARAEGKAPYSYERVAGRLVVMSPDGFGHSYIAMVWRNALGSFHLDQPETIQYVFSPGWVRIDDDTERIPDIAVYLHSQKPALPVPDRVPDLVIEFVSPGRVSRDRDYIAKRADYHRLGVREYLIADRFDRRLTVLSYTPGDYAGRVLGPADTYTSPLLPGFALPLAGALGPEEGDDGDD